MENPIVEMDGGDAVVASIKAKLESLPSLSDESIIYRVPDKLRRQNPDAYTPRVVSIGPFHRGKVELQAMEAHKLRYLQSFIPRTHSSVEDFVSVARIWEQKARNCYAEHVELSSDEFVEMLVVDGSFIVEFLLRSRFSELREDKERIYGRSEIITDVCRDMILMENQLPFFVIKGFFSSIVDEGTPSCLSCLKLAQRYFSLFIAHIDDERSITEPVHFVDLLRSCCLPVVQVKSEETILDVYTAPEATVLHAAGVRFKPAETSNCLFDITFVNGLLKIPTIVIDDLTESLYRNIIVFEQCHCSAKIFLHYTTLIGCFIRSPTDANLLIHNDILVSHSGNAEDVSELFNSICREVSSDPEFYFSTLAGNLQAYCNTPWNRWKSTLLLDYFNSSWSGISVCAATFLLILILIQTVCSILGLV